MDTNPMVSKLVEEGVLSEDDNSGEFVLSQGFTESVASYRQELDDTSVSQLSRETTKVERPELVEAFEQDPSFGAKYLALESWVSDLEFDDRLQMLFILDLFTYETPPINGVPEAFFPVRGERLPALLPSIASGIVYIWRQDCDPCDTMKDVFDDLFDEPPGDMTLLAVFGPDCPELLYEEYDVVGGPATLFILDGEVDSRLLRAHYKETVEKEIETIRQLSTMN